MKRIAIFLAGKIVKDAWGTEYGYKILLYSIITMSSSVLAGYFIADIYDLVVREQVADRSKFLLFVSFNFAVFFLLLDLVPVYKANPFLFPNYYPLRKIYKAIFILLYNSIRYYTTFILFTYFFWYFLSPWFGLVELMSSLVFIFCGYLLNRILKNLTDYTVPQGKFVLGAVIVLLAGHILYLYYFSVSGPAYHIVLLFFFLSLFICFIWSEVDKKIKNVGASHFSVLTSKSIYLRLLSNPSISSAILYAFLFKILWSLILILELKYSENSQPGLGAGAIFINSPLIIFGYIALNFFGYQRNLFFTHLIREWQIKKMAVVYLKSVGILLLVDGLLFWIFILISGYFSWHIVLFYYTVTIVQGILCFWFALYKPNFEGTNSIGNESGFSITFNKNINWWGLASISILYFIVDAARQYFSLYGLIYAILITVVVTGALYYKPRFTSIARYAYRQIKKSE